MTVFLTAEWRALLMLNYLIEPEVLRPLVPAGTELDTWNDRTYASLVGFRFEKTRLLGVPVPGHSKFEEVNLRFYVRRRAGGEWRRGVAFIREIVPKAAVAAIARWVYNEPYVTARMRHVDAPDPGGSEADRIIGYSWRSDGGWNTVQAATSGPAALPEAGSEAEFITEHYWGYTAQRDGSSREYRVAHDPWLVRMAVSAELKCDVASVYGPQYCEALNAAPVSAFVAAGSAIEVYRGVPT